MKQWQWVVRLLARRMWVRAALFCMFAVALALASALIGHNISYEFAATIGAKSVDNILNVLATSMLAVTTFSLTAMVSAYSGATSNITPRAVQLLIDDTTAQNSLATFLGSFLFAIVGIIALSTGAYGETGRVILFAGTIVVIVVIVITFLRWIEHISRFGRVGDTISRVERAATKAAQDMSQRLLFGPVTPRDVPAGKLAIFPSDFGRITHIDLDQLGQIAGKSGTDIHLIAFTGGFVDPASPLAWTASQIDDDQRCAIRDAYTLADNRVFDNDPRFGLVVLSEIASRALSPAVNDPGTAIAAIEAGSRVLAAMLGHKADRAEDRPSGVKLPPLFFRDLMEDLFRPIARDGAGTIEVGIRLQKTLAALGAVSAAARPDCRLEADDARARASDGLRSAMDREELDHVYKRCWGVGIT